MDLGFKSCHVSFFPKSHVIFANPVHWNPGLRHAGWDVEMGCHGCSKSIAKILLCCRCGLGRQDPHDQPVGGLPPWKFTGIHGDFGMVAPPKMHLTDLVCWYSPLNMLFTVVILKEYWAKSSGSVVNLWHWCNLWIFFWLLGLTSWKPQLVSSAIQRSTI